MNASDVLARFDRVRLTCLPTPLEFAPNLTAALGGPEIYIKRDDVGALAFGGNKTRKLEYLMAEAVAMRADTLVTLGGVQSNWVRQAISAARHMGMDAVAVLEGEEPDECQGNLLLDRMMGARLIFRPGISQEAEDLEIAGAFPVTGPIARELAAQGKRPYLCPLGGATPVGGLGYVRAVVETEAQLAEMGVSPDYLVAATGTGGTQAGIECGLRLSGSAMKLLGMSVSYHTRPKEEEIAELCNRSMARYGSDERFLASQISVNYDYVGKGYGDVTPESEEAVALAARCEGLILCTTYAGKAMAGLIGLCRRGVLRKGQRVVFLHTGGAPAVFADAARYREACRRETPRGDE